MAAPASNPEGNGWAAYLGAFHARWPGITEAVLTRATTDDGDDPYDWLARALPDHGIVVDLACGSGPLAARSPPGWIGLDNSAAELGHAARIAPGRVALGDGTSPPLRAGAADAVVCSMALMLFDDPQRVAIGMTRLLRPAASLVALLPSTAPLTLRDRARYARLMAALGLRRLPFRHHHVLRRPHAALTAAGLTVTHDDRRRFAYPVTDPDAARLWPRSLYLPDLDPHRQRAARQLTARWTGTDIGLPLRRIVATT